MVTNANCDVRVQVSTDTITNGAGFSDTAIPTSSGDPFLIWDETHDSDPWIRSTTFVTSSTGARSLTICHDAGATNDDFKFLLYKIYLIAGSKPSSHGGTEYPSVGVNTGKVICHSEDYPSPTTAYYNVGTRIQPHTMRTSLKYKKATYFPNNKIRTSTGYQISGPFPVEIDEWLTIDETAPHSYDMHLLPPDPQHGIWFQNFAFNTYNFVGLGEASGDNTQWNSTVHVGTIFDSGMLGMSGVPGGSGSSFTAGRYYL